MGLIAPTCEFTSKDVESEVKSSHQMVIKAVWPNYMIFFFVRLIFNVQVETFEDFGSSGFTECTSITDSQNSFPVHHKSRFTDPKNGWWRRHDNKLAPPPPPRPWFRLERSRWVLTRSFNVIHEQIYMWPGVWYMYPYQGDFQTKLFLGHFSNNFD